MSDEDKVATGERLAFLTLSKQLASSNNKETRSDGEENTSNWRSSIIATEDGLMNGDFAGISEDGRFLRVANLETPLGKIDKCSLRDTDVLFTRFQLSENELIDINAARTRSYSFSFFLTGPLSSSPCILKFFLLLLFIIFLFFCEYVIEVWMKTHSKN